MGSRMRGLLVLAMAMAMVWALALPGAAKRPDKPGAPGGGGGGGPTLSVDVFDAVHELPASPSSDEGRMHWILEVGDQIRVWATVTGMDTGGAVLCLVTTTGEVCEPFDDGVMAPYAVSLGDLKPDFEAAVEVRVDGATVLSEAFSMQSEVGFPECDFAEVNGSLRLSSESGIECLWHASPADVGEWTATLDPFGSPQKPTQVFVTLRDHMPGNWCATSPESHSGISGRMKPNDSMSVNWLIPANGICLKDGMADRASMGVGTPGTYILVLTGDLTLTR